MRRVNNRLRAGVRSAIPARKRSVSAIAVAAALSLASGAFAATLTWDPGSVPATPTGGAGVWDLNSTADWSNGTADVKWTDNSALGTDLAVFGNVGGAVSLNTSLSALGLTFNASGYALSGTGTLSLGNNGITLAAGSSASISNNIALVGQSQTWTVNTGSALTTGNLTRVPGSGTAVQFIPTGTISTTTANTAGDILGGWATVGTTGGTTLDWATSAGTGSVAGAITPYSNYVTSIASANSTSDFKGSGTLTGDLTVNSLIETADIHLAGHKLTVASGGIIFETQNFWMQDSGGILTTGLPSGEMFVHCPNATLTDQQIFVSIQDNGATPLIFVKDGPGTLYITGPNNTYSGGTIINGGTLSLNKGSPHTGSMGSANAPLTVNSGATLDLSAVSQGISLLGGTGGTITSSSGTPIFTVGNNSATGATWPGTLTGSLGLTKTGTGTLALTGFNTYSGGTIINGGSLKLTAGNNGTGAVRGVITVNTGGTLIVGGHDVFGYNNAATTVSTINLVGGTLDDQSNATNETTTGVTINMTGGTISATVGNSFFQTFSNGYGDTTINTLASPISSLISSRLDLRQASKILTFTVASGSVPSGGPDLLVSGAITESTTGSAITKAGPGIMQLTAAGTYTGGTNVTGGTLILNSATGTNLAAGYINTGTLTIGSGATVDTYVNAFGFTATTLPPVVINGGTMTQFTSAAGPDSHLGAVTMTGGTISGNLPANIYDPHSNFTINAAPTTATVSAGLSLQGDIGFAVAGGLGANPDLLVSGVVSGAHAITKSGNGVMVVSGNNSYSTSTTVSGGTLLVNNTAGSGTGSGPVNVGANAILGGSGTISGATTIGSGATLAPSGTATTPIGAPLKISGAVAFTDNTSNFIVNLVSTTPGTGYDQVQYGSTFALANATLTVKDGSYSPKLNDVFWVVDAAVGNTATLDQVSGQFNGLANNAIYTSASGVGYRVNYNVAGDPNITSNDIKLTVTAVPEPTSLGALAFAAVGLLARRRRVKA